jgi:signal transduction histidine kinase
MIRIRMSMRGKKWFKTCLSNHYKPDMQVIDKKGIGMVNISEMMRRMGGVCTVEMTEDYYRIILAFPICG